MIPMQSGFIIQIIHYLFNHEIKAKNILTLLKYITHKCM